MSPPRPEAAADAKTTSWRERFASLFPRGQVVRYLGAGIFNTLFGYCTYAGILILLDRVAPQRFLYLTVIAASLLSTPLNISISYFNYKFFVFRTRGNYLREWVRAFGVYGISMLPGLVMLSGLTRLFQALLGKHASFGKGAAGYLAGAIIMGGSAIIGFIGHKNVTFAQRRQSTQADTQK